MMLKAAALYIVIIISLMIAIISASLLSVAFYYRLQYQYKVRIDRLQENIQSGTEILLSSDFETADQDLVKDLFNDGNDSVTLHQQNWGVYQLNTIQTNLGTDTLRRAFLSGLNYTDAAAIYLADEDRPLSVSGNTIITGDGELPKSGIKQSYVDGKPYKGKELIKGKIKTSARDLPSLQENWISKILEAFKLADAGHLAMKDSLINTFYNKSKVYSIPVGQETLSGLKFKGKVILISDTTVVIESNTVLEDVLLYAPSIIIKDRFKGSCQLFARDSIAIGKQCEFHYPSFAGVFKSETSKIQAKISLGAESKFSGVLLSYEKKRSDLQTIITLGKDCLLKGEVFATGFIQLEAPLKVYGKVYTKRFIMRKAGVFYENFLIDVELNRKLLSKYYLSTPMMGGNKQDLKILKWLN
jgi:hypothetical protein